MGINIVFREEEQELFLQHWLDILHQKRASSRYFPLNIESNLMFSRARSLLVGDKSFIYVRDNRPVAGVFLPIEGYKGNFTISILNHHVDAPLVIDRTAEDKVFNIIDTIAQKNNVAKIMFAVDPLSGDSDTSYNYLQKYNYLDTSVLSYVIDLQVKDLFSVLRRNHRRNISRILQDQDFLVFVTDQRTPSYEYHEEFRKLHYKCAGKVTASKEIFDLQFEKLKQGQAVLFGLRYKGRNIAYMYFEYSFDKAISYQAADDPDYDKLPLYHVLTFAAMQYLQGKGVKHIDTGQPSGPSHQMDYYPDQKQRNIGLFKYGFGGNFVSQFRGSKFFSKTLLEDDVKSFVNSYRCSQWD